MNQPLLIPKTLDEKYREWRQTPHGRIIYAEALRRALFLQTKGLQHLGVKFILESIRWDRLYHTGIDAEGFKVNNNTSSRLSREIMQEQPLLQDFFETRALKG